jgi:hypothetical protein
MDMMVAFLREVYGDPVVNTSVNNVEYAPHVDPSWDPFSIVHKVRGPKNIKRNLKGERSADLHCGRFLGPI